MRLIALPLYNKLEISGASGNLALTGTVSQQNFLHRGLFPLIINQRYKMSGAADLKINRLSLSVYLRGRLLSLFAIFKSTI